MSNHSERDRNASLSDAELVHAARRGDKRAFLEIANDALGTWPETCLARQMARPNPAEALDWASRLPGNRAINAGGEAFAEWRSSQPEAATQRLNALPAADARREPFFQSAIRLLAYDPQALKPKLGPRRSSPGPSCSAGCQPVSQVANLRASWAARHSADWQSAKQSRSCGSSLRYGVAAAVRRPTVRYPG